MADNERQMFYNALYEKFQELRPQFSETKPDLKNPIYQKLYLIDKTLTNTEAFEAGFSIWLENKDTDAFLNLFIVQENGSIKVNDSPADSQ